MIIDIITIFPEMFSGIINSSIIKRAIDKQIIKINIHDFRLFSTNKHHKVDDTPYGGGAGMLIKCQPVIDCLKNIENYSSAHKIITSPTGIKYNQQKASDLSQKDHIIIICGHYEGMDERVVNYIDEEISIGDYILTGGEIASMAIVDSIIRLIPEVIRDESIVTESFSASLLEYPQYTKPSIYDELKVPEVLLNGNHEEIRKFRCFESLKKTYLKRPDLLENYPLNKEEEKWLDLIKKGITDYGKIY